MLQEILIDLTKTCNKVPDLSCDGDQANAKKLKMNTIVMVDDDKKGE